MQHVRSQATFAEQLGLFRAARARDVFACNCLRTPNESLPKVSIVDFFISHSWHCSSWMKRLAVCHCLNLNLAIASSGLTCLFGVFILLLRAGSFPAVAQQPGLLVWCLLCGWPMVVFLGAYLCGHLLDHRDFWLDEICVDQTDSELKVQTLQALPAFVAQSKEMLVIWDETYFQRLWCNYELAVRAKACPEAIQVVPIWMPLWVLCTFAILSLVSLSTSGTIGSQNSSLEFDLDSRFSFMISWINQFLTVTVLATLSVAVPCSWLCMKKLQMHGLMLNEMEQFDLRSAKCTLEADRRVIEQQVLDLFDEALEPPLCEEFGTSAEPADVPLISRADIEEIRNITSYPSHEAVIDQFNEYIRGPLRESVEESMGKEDYISLTACIATNLPWLFSGLVVALRCDCQSNCELAAGSYGYVSVSQYMLSNAFLNIIVTGSFFILWWPLALKTNSMVAQAVSDKVWQKFLGFICTALGLAMLNFWLILQTMLVVVVLTRKYSPLWSGACFAGFGLELCLASFFFGQKVSPFKASSGSRASRALCLA